MLFAILATIANYQIVCCEAVRLAILATAWLLVCCVFVFSVLLFRVVFIFIIFYGGRRQAYSQTMAHNTECTPLYIFACNK